MCTAMLIIQIRRSEQAVMLMVIANPENPVDAWTIPPVTGIAVLRSSRYPKWLGAVGLPTSLSRRGFSR
jgi:hypothetical protein